MDNSHFQWAIHTVKTGLSANEGLRQLRAMDAGINRAQWLATVRAVKDELESNSVAFSRTGNRKPYRKEIFVMTTAVETGFMQHIDIFVKDNDTGEVYSRPYSIRTDTLLTHDDAIETALDRYEDHAKRYGHTILGAAYSTTYELVPERK